MASSFFCNMIIICDICECHRTPTCLTGEHWYKSFFPYATKDMLHNFGIVWLLGIHKYFKILDNTYS